MTKTTLSSKINANIINNTLNLKILDVGVGTGLTQLEYLELKVNNTKLITPIQGIYWNKQEHFQELNISQERYDEIYQPQQKHFDFWKDIIEFQNKDIINEIQLIQNYSYDIINISQLLHHLKLNDSEISLLVNQLRSKLKIGGYLFIESYKKYDLGELFFKGEYIINTYMTTTIHDCYSDIFSKMKN